MSMRNEIYKNDGNDMCYYEICQLYKTMAAAVGTIMKERRTLREEEKKKEKNFFKLLQAYYYLKQATNLTELPISQLTNQLQKNAKNQ